jgi:hypothetical protein
MWVGLSDGRVIGAQLAWFPCLMRAAPEERESFEISPLGIHWQALHEDVLVEGLLAGRGRRARRCEQRGGSLTHPTC